MKTAHPIDKTLLFLILILSLGGYFIFLSASSGLLVREAGASFSSVAFNQTFHGLLPGLLFLIIFSLINYKKWRKYSFYIFVFSIFLSLTVFIPGIGFEHGGAKRWINIFSFTFQPSELLKLGTIIYAAALFTAFKEKIQSVRYGFVTFIVLAAIVSGILLSEPDVDTLAVILTGLFAVYFVSGGNLKHIAVTALISVLVLAASISFLPYIKDRVFIFLNPDADSTGSGYQIRQSLIAIGTGGFLGKGFGQSSQKFGYLPEPIGDSVFAVYSEEFGFVGAFILIMVFMLFAARALQISSKIPDNFGRTLGVGIITMIMIQTFINISAMIKIVPISGITLPFVSHGGSALFFALIEAGILLNLSRYKLRG